MGSDRARNTYDERQQYRSVVAQQGRVVIEADLNEAQELASEEQRAEALDVVGPKGTPDDGYAVSFEVPAPNSGFDFVVKPGTMYVGGLRVTRPGPEHPEDLTYFGQKNTEWVDGPEKLRGGDPQRELISLHLSEREVSGVEDESLREVALGGPDTSQRTRLTQHIMRLGVSGTVSNCVSALHEARVFWTPRGQELDEDTMRLLPAARLQVGFVPPETRGDAVCEPATQAAYLGAENQLLRIQVSENRKLLWSQDNGSQLYRVDLIDKRPVLKLKTSPVDDFHFPKEGQVVEVLRAAVRLANGQSTAAPTGLLFKLGANPYEPDERLLTLSVAQNDQRLADLSDEKPPALFVRIWEEELDPGSKAKPSPLGRTGVCVFREEGNKSPFVPGDYWMVAVRPSTPQRLYPERYLEGAQPPDGPRQWICPLAVVEWTRDNSRNVQGKVLEDCRPRFDNLVGLTSRVEALEQRPAGGGCCTVTVTPEELAQQPLQARIEALVEKNKRNPVTVCLRPGIYKLPEPLRLDEHHTGLTLEGCRGAVLTFDDALGKRFLDGIIVLEQANRITLRGLELGLRPIDFIKADGANLASLPFEQLKSRADPLMGFLEGFKVGIGLRLVNSSQVTIEDCRFNASDFVQRSFSAGISANGTCNGLEVRDNQFLAATPAAGTPEWQRMAFGYLHTPSTELQPTTAPTVPLARETSVQGRLVSAALDEALFRGNQFSFLSAAIFIHADAGSVRLESNQVRHGYAGFWLMNLLASAYAGVTNTAELAQKLTPTLDELRALLRESDFSVQNPQGIVEFYKAGLALLTDPLVVVASTLARGYPLPSNSKNTGPLVSVSVPHPDADAVRSLSLLAIQAASWLPPGSERMSEIPFALSNDLTAQDNLFGPLHRILADIEQQLAPALRPQQPSFHVSDNEVDTGRDNAPAVPSTAALTLWDAEKPQPKGAPQPMTLLPLSVLVSHNRLRNRTVLQPTARLLNVEQSTITGNLCFNQAPPDVTTGRLPWSFLLVPIKVVQPAAPVPPVPAATAITGNVFTGLTALPTRLDFPNLPWAQLNTLRSSR